MNVNIIQNNIVIVNNVTIKTPKLTKNTFVEIKAYQLFWATMCSKI